MKRVSAIAEMRSLVEEICEDVVRAHTIINPLRPAAGEFILTRQAAHRVALNSLEGLLKDYRDAIAKVHAASISALKAEADLFKYAVDFLQRFTKDTDPLTSLLKAWLEDNSLTMDRYFIANATAISNAMTGGDILEPLKRWRNIAHEFMRISNYITAIMTRHAMTFIFHLSNMLKSSWLIALTYKAPG